MRGRGRRYNRGGGYQYSSARRQPQKQYQSIVDKEEISKIVKDYIAQEKKQEKRPREEARIIDCTAYTWEDFESKFQDIEDKMQIGTGKAEEEDYDITVYTDAWDPNRVFEFAMMYWDILNVEGAEIRRDNIDIITFSCYFSALCELFLAGQDSLDGIDGHNRNSIRAAKYELQKRKIPEFIGDMFLGLRPIVLEEERVRVVLMPHKAVRMNGRAIQARNIAAIGGGNNHADFMFRRSQIIVKRAFQLPAAPVAVPGTVRFNWMAKVMNFLDGRAAAHYTPREMNQLIGYGHFIKRYSQSTFCANFALPINYTHDWYDYWLEVNIDFVIEKWTGRLFTGFGNEYMYQPRLGRHLPMMIINYIRNEITWSEESIREQWIPWFTAGTRQAMNNFVGAFAAQVENIRINRLHQRNQALVGRREYAQRMSRLIQGAPRALEDKPP